MCRVKEGAAEAHRAKAGAAGADSWGPPWEPPWDLGLAEALVRFLATRSAFPPSSVRGVPPKSWGRLRPASGSVTASALDFAISVRVLDVDTLEPRLDIS